MSTMNQKTAVMSTILAVLSDRGATYELSGPVALSEVITEGDRKTVREALFAGFRSGAIEMSEEMKQKASDDAYLKNYVSGLLNNWTRKAKEFNCGKTYEAKNPGSRAGSGDEQIKEMKKLLNATKDEEGRKQIQEAIDARMAEIKPAKVEVDFSKIPESLRAKLGIQ